jgi:hypothetical protein
VTDDGRMSTMSFGLQHKRQRWMPSSGKVAGGVFGGVVSGKPASRSIVAWTMRVLPAPALRASAARLSAPRRRTGPCWWSGTYVSYMGPHLPHCLLPTLATEDQDAAYKSVPVAASLLHLTVLAILHPGKGTVRFAVSYAHLFALEAAVQNYNRLSELINAFTRRALAIPSWHFFDDFGYIQTPRDWNTADIGLNAVLAAMGVPAQAKKRREPSVKQLHLGLVHDFSRVAMDEGILDVKPGRAEACVEKILDVLRDGEITGDECASLRGDLMFMATTSYGKVYRVK